MGSVATDLKLERERKKISLAQIAADTRISLRHLQSLEEGRYCDLPGGIYNRAFLKAYCESINVDEQEILQRYEAEISPPFEKSPKTKVHFFQRHAFLGPSPILSWSLMLLISASGVFFSRKWIASVFSPYFSHAPVTSVRYESPPEPVTSTGQPTTIQSELESAASTPSNLAPSVPMPSTASKTPVQGPSAPSSEETIPSVAASTPSLRLEFAVTEKCWISVDSDGASVTRKIMEPGEVQSFSAAEQLRIVVGNAGGVHLRINGKAIKPLGKPGEVVKMLINVKNLQDLIDPTAG